MDTPPQPHDPTALLLRDAYYQLIHTLRASLPPPVTDTPEDVARRDNAVIAQVACLLPLNADQANLAAQYVAANAGVLDCLRLAQEHRGDPKFFLKCNALATGMMRQARAIRTLLLRVQAKRRKLEADSAAANGAAWTEHSAIGLMTDALGVVEPAAMAEPPQPPPPPPQPQAEAPVSDPIAEAERYAVLYPQLAARIRALSRLSGTVTARPDPAIGPPSAELTQASIAGNRPALRAPDAKAAACEEQGTAMCV
jgi:hypothetical protein